MSDDSYPLTERHLENLDVVLANCARVKTLLEKCKRVPLEVDDLCRECEQQRTLAEALKREFFRQSI